MTLTEPGTAQAVRPVVVVEPGRGHRVGNVEFLARTVDTPGPRPWCYT